MLETIGSRFDRSLEHDAKASAKLGLNLGVKNRLALGRVHDFGLV
ncbi:MAG: hypothetical protein JWM36_2560 [Hyphomicrobiales bacterium]|nr:hypothetical protein [Hyphomicrobiales bacterium]